MATIDQRILIPAPQDGVWAYLSDIGNNPSWQTDCRSISFLSSKRQGVGARWRVTDDKGHDAIYEILSWYNGLGYEYTCIDGCTYRESRVRIRLQEIAEGTIVQWTYSFEPKGLLSGRGARQLENIMAASLKSLYRQVKTANKSGQLTTARSLMQDSPDVGGRSAYQPRHTTQYDEKKLTPGTPMQAITEPPIVEDDGQAFEAFVFEEPPIVESDTRPHPVVTETGESAALKAEKAAVEVPVVLDEPDFLADVPSPDEFAPDFDLDMPVAGTAETFVDDAIFAPPAEPEKAAEPLPSQVMTEALDIVVQPAESGLADRLQVSSVEPPKTTLVDRLELSSIEASEPGLADRLEITSVDPLETQDLPPLESETAEKPAQPLVLPVSSEHRSIWDIFGVPKPSDTGTTVAAIPQESEETIAAIPAEAASEPKMEAPLVFRHGFRARERRKIARIRYPQ